MWEGVWVNQRFCASAVYSMTAWKPSAELLQGTAGLFEDTTADSLLHCLGEKKEKICGTLSLLIIMEDEYQTEN